MSFSIIGVGSGLPSIVKNNHQLSEIMDTDHEWIFSRTGIEERRLCGEETITDIAFYASEKALNDAGIDAEELDMIICATCSPDYATPSMSCLIQERLGVTCTAFDVNAACSGFIYALDIAEGYFLKNPNMKILVVGADAISKLVNWSDRTVSSIFADGAGAVILGAGEDLLSIKLSAKGCSSSLVAKNSVGNCPFRDNDIDVHGLKMKGQDVFKFAVTSMKNDVEEVLEKAQMTKDEVAYILPHQANQRILDKAMKKLKMDDSKCLSNIRFKGNTSAGAIPVLLDEEYRKGTFKKGDKLVFTAFGAGLTTGACVLRWNKS